jgi:hypothetical protein
VSADRRECRVADLSRRYGGAFRGAADREHHEVMVDLDAAYFSHWYAEMGDTPLKGAGFTDVEVAGREDWLAAERAAWQVVLSLPPSDDPAMRSLQEEARQVLDGDVPRRVLAVGHRRP